MKKLLFLGCCSLLLASCTLVKYYPYEAAWKIDYKPLNEKGLFISESDIVDFKYQPLGSVMIEVRMGEFISSKVVSDEITKDDLYGSTKNRKFINNKTDIDKVLIDRIESELNKLSANGIIGLRVALLAPLSIDKNITYGPGYFVTGMAIKK